MSRNKNGFPSGGCPIPMGNNQICGETQTLEIIKEFRKLYEDKMKKIQSGGDYQSGLQATVNLQQNWIRDLTEQNEMLVRAVEELELEATDRVAMLEEKLCKSAQQGNEVMQKYRDFNFAINLDETFQSLVYLQSDVNNLLEFIKRARDEGTWSIDGLHFYNITCEDLFGSPTFDQGIGDQKMQKQLKMSQKLEQKEKMLRESKEKLDRIPNETEALAVRLKEKDQELSTLRRSMLDMRNALTIEVAEKHDVILNLRRDVQQLEEKYRQANKQTQFKDDIIKEMRKEIKLLKGQVNPERLKSYSPSRFPEPLPSFHKCCPYVKDLCPLNSKNKELELITYFKRSKDTSKHHTEEKAKTNSSSQNNEVFTSSCEKNFTYDLSTSVQANSSLTTRPDKLFEINAQVTLTSKSHSPRLHKNACDASSSESVPRKVLPQINFYSERSIPESQTQQKTRSTLTSGTILHEYYGMKKKGDVFGIVENYNETQKSICAPKHVSVKTFITNLEENAKEKTQSENKKEFNKKVTMSGEDSFLKFT